MTEVGKLPKQLQVSQVPGKSYRGKKNQKDCLLFSLGVSGGAVAAVP